MRAVTLKPFIHVFLLPNILHDVQSKHCKNYSPFHTRAGFRQFLLGMSMFFPLQDLLMRIQVCVITSMTCFPEIQASPLGVCIKMKYKKNSDGQLREAQRPHIKDALQCLSEEYGCPDYLRVISIAEQETYSGASGL